MSDGKLLGRFVKPILKKRKSIQKPLLNDHQRVAVSVLRPAGDFWIDDLIDATLSESTVQAHRNRMP